MVNYNKCMKPTIKQLQDLLPEYIDEKHPKGDKDRGKVTVEIVLFLIWASEKLDEKRIK